MWGIPFDEDAYWERRREEYENPKMEPEDNLELISDSIYLDEEVDGIEAKYGCPVKSLQEDELLDIIEEFRGIAAEEAVWNEQFQGIDFKYYEGEFE